MNADEIIEDSQYLDLTEDFTKIDLEINKLNKEVDRLERELWEFRRK